MKKVLLVLVLSLLVSSPVWGFDGQRKGFILGGGLGLGATSYKEKQVSFVGSTETDWRNKFGFMTDFKIGYAPTHQLEIFYSDKGSWFDYDGAIGLTGLGAVGVSYYLKPEAPTFYLGCGTGVSTFITSPLKSGTDTDLGFGFYAGGGYEFVKHFAIQLDFMYGIPKESSGGFKNTFMGFTPRIIFIGTAF